MYRLYWAKSSGAIAPQVLFEEIGVDYEKIVIDLDREENRSAEFLAVNPAGQIPALVLPDGTLMTESAAMVLQIVDRHPEASSRRRRRAPNARSSSAGCSSWPRRCTPPSFASTTRTVSRRTRTARRESRPPPAADMNRALSILDEALDPGPYLLGETLSAADIYLWMLTQWHPDPAQMSEQNPRVGRLVELVHARPAVARVWAQHEED